MSVAIKDLTIQPHRFRSGSTQRATLRYRGVIAEEEDKRVRLRYSLKDKDHPVFLIDENGKKVKELRWEQEFPGKTREFTREIAIRVTEAADDTTEVETELVATSTEDESACITFILYK
jgi:hypothetical protein